MWDAIPTGTRGIMTGLFVIMEPGKYYTRSQILDTPNTFYVFGDNDERSGFGGQAKHARGCKNAIGVRTKKRPTRDIDAYYCDNEYDENIRKISEDIKKIREKLREGLDVVCPAGLGEGRAELPFRAPQTYEFLKNEIILLHIDFGDKGELPESEDI